MHRTYVLVRVGTKVVLGYYALMPEVVERETLSKKRGRGFSALIPGYLVANLALDRSLRAQGSREQLLDLAIQRAAQAAEAAGGGRVLVDALDAEAESFYIHHGLDPVPGHPCRLLIAAEDLRAS